MLEFIEPSSTTEESSYSLLMASRLAGDSLVVGCWELPVYKYALAPFAGALVYRLLRKLSRLGYTSLSVLGGIADDLFSTFCGLVCFLSSDALSCDLSELSSH